EPERGAAAVAALTAVLEARRDATAPPVAAELQEEAPAEPTPEPATVTRPVALPAQEIDLEELGVADRLGLADTEDDDEVGPTA
ncbi:MAG: cell division ATP-binding protein FtsE, partial [Gemmatimonadota bacterium]|nr:cell division ATP-binding protein FtsE [Gemmatimonadota bacterium]